MNELLSSQAMGILLHDVRDSLRTLCTSARLGVVVILKLRFSELYRLFPRRQWSSKRPFMASPMPS